MYTVQRAAHPPNKSLYRPRHLWTWPQDGSEQYHGPAVHVIPLPVCLIPHKPGCSIEEARHMPVDAVSAQMHLHNEGRKCPLQLIVPQTHHEEASAMLSSRIRGLWYKAYTSAAVRCSSSARALLRSSALNPWNAACWPERNCIRRLSAGPAMPHKGITLGQRCSGACNRYCHTRCHQPTQHK